MYWQSVKKKGIAIAVLAVVLGVLCILPFATKTANAVTDEQNHVHCEVEESLQVGFSTHHAVCYHTYNVTAATCTVAKKCTKCGYIAQKALGHKMQQYVNKQPTCTTGGTYITKCSVCGTGSQYGNGTITMLGHSWNSGTVTKSATCTATGTKTFKCTRSGCTATKTESIAALGHNKGAAATCTTAQTCKRCSAVLQNKLGHSWDAGTVTKAATCTATGVKTFKCKRSGCTATYTETIPMIAHNCEWRVTVQPSCKGSGTNQYTCKVCGTGTAWQSIQYYGDHTWAAATCTKAKTCSVCGKTEGSALGHAYAWRTTVNATCTTGGKKEQYCTRSGCTSVVNRQDTSALGHAWDSGTVTKAATHSATGVKTFKCTRSGCTATKTESIPVIAHSYTWVITTPSTCTKEGVESYKCSCGAVSQTRAIAKAAHNGKWSVTVQPSCAGSGTEECKCTVCGTWLGARSIQYYGDHTYDRSAADCTHDKMCTVCGYVAQKAPGHVYNGAATCTTDKKCSVCGYIAQKALGHNYQTVTTKQPTCTEKGVYVSECTRCGDIAKDGNGYIGATGHKWDIDASEVTCTRGQKCTVCGATGTETKEHDCEWVTITVATETVAGVEGYACKNCGEVMQERLAEQILEIHVAGGASMGLAPVLNYCSSYAVITLPELDLPEGYVLEGYADSPDDDVVKYQPNTKFPMIKGRKLYAVVKPIKYTITLCDNTGDDAGMNPGSIYTITDKRFSQKISLPSCSDTENMVFLGYAETRDATKAQYGMVKTSVFGEPTEILYTVMCNKTLFAVWHKHSWNIDKLVDSTCTETGIKECTCIDCGATKTVVLEKKDHKYEWKVTQPADCVNPGKYELICECGKVIDGRSIQSYGGHHWECFEKTDATCNCVCTGCGITMLRAHDYMLTKIEPATCEENGWLYYACKYCGTKDFECILACGHDEEFRREFPSADSCLHKEYLACKNCDYEYVTIEKYDHDWVPFRATLDKDFADKNPGVTQKCGNPGEVAYRCSRCGEVEVRWSSKIPHDLYVSSYEIDGRTKIEVICSRCGNRYVWGSNELDFKQFYKACQNPKSSYYTSKHYDALTSDQKQFYYDKWLEYRMPNTYNEIEEYGKNGGVLLNLGSVNNNADDTDNLLTLFNALGVAAQIGDDISSFKANQLKGLLNNYSGKTKKEMQEFFATYTETSAYMDGLLFAVRHAAMGYSLFKLGNSCINGSWMDTYHATADFVGTIVPFGDKLVQIPENGAKALAAFGKFYQAYHLDYPMLAHCLYAADQSLYDKALKLEHASNSEELEAAIKLFRATDISAETLEKVVVEFADCDSNEVEKNRKKTLVLSFYCKILENEFRYHAVKYDDNKGFLGVDSGTWESYVEYAMKTFGGFVK